MDAFNGLGDVLRRESAGQKEGPLHPRRQRPVEGLAGPLAAVQQDQIRRGGQRRRKILLYADLKAFQMVQPGARARRAAM